MANRFEELDAKLAELEAALDDPDAVGSVPEFLVLVNTLTGEAHTISTKLTEEDFESEYTTEEGEEDETDRQPEFA